MGVDPRQNVQNYVQHVCDRITRFTGGCTVQRGTGQWREDSLHGAALYVAPMQTENAVTVSTTVKTDDIDGTLRKLRREWREAHAEFRPPIQWIHVEYHKLETAHFDASVEEATAAKVTA